MLDFAIFSAVMLAVLVAAAYCGGLMLCGVNWIARVVGFIGIWGILNGMAALNANNGAAMKALVAGIAGAFQ